MFFADTNILLHAVNRDSPEHVRTAEAVQSYASGTESWAISWSVFYEFLRVATHPRIFPKPLPLRDAYGFIAGLMAQDSCLLLVETAQHQQVLEASMGEVHRLTGNLLHDFHNAVLMREHGICDVVTLDTDFKAFPWLNIRPL